MAGFPKAGDQYGGRYRIVSEIGHGGMGVVYEAVDTVLNRSVALKIVLPSLADRDEYHQRFAQEAAALAKIQSRHIVGIYDYGEHEDTVFFATQYFPDGDLQSWLAEHGPLDRRAALSLVAQLCEALADAHAAGVVHRDVKPGNVLLWSRPEGLVPYLADFGIAVEGQQEKRTGLTRTGTLIGSPAYMAPERHFGHPADERGDVYSAGCLLWAALTGDAPYAGTDFQMMNSHINAAVVTLGTDHPVDMRIDAVLAGALEKDPDRRIPSAAAMRSQLLDIVREIDSAALPVPLPPTSEPPAGPPTAAPEDSGHTVVRPAMVPPPSEPPPPPVPPPAPAPASAPASAPAPEPAPAPVPEPAAPAPAAPAAQAPAAPAARDLLEPRARRPRRWLVPVLLSAALVLVLAVVTAVLVNGQGGEPAADDPTASATTSSSTSTSPSPSESEKPAVAPKPPTIGEPRSAYRAVVFPVSAPAGAVAQYFTDGSWRPVRQGQVQLRTERGGQEACLRSRSVAASGAAKAPPSGETKRCGTSQPPTITLTRTAQASCSYYDPDRDFTYPCWWYGVELSGFESGTSQAVRLHQVGKPDDCPTATSCQSVRVDQAGRASKPQFIRVVSDLGTWVAQAGGVQTRVVLRGPYKSS